MQEQLSAHAHRCSVQFSSVTQSYLTLCDPMNGSTPGFLSITNFQSLLKLMSIESVTPSNHLILCHPLFLPPSIFPRNRGFSKESVLHIRWPKNWSFSFSINPSNECSGLISLRMDWFDLLAVQGTLKSLLQHHSSKSLILQRSAFFMVQLSHPYMTTGKTIALNRWTFVGKVMSLLFSMLFRLVMAFLPRSKNLLISWLHSPSAVILEPKKIKCFAIPFSSGPCFARTLHHDQSFMGGLTHHNFIELDKAVVHVAMAPHSTTLAWKIPWTEEPDRLQSMRSLRVRHS